MNILERALRNIKRAGWIQQAHVTSYGYCIMGAMFGESYGKDELQDYRLALEKLCYIISNLQDNPRNVKVLENWELVTIIVGFNDSHKRTLSDILYVLRQALNETLVHKNVNTTTPIELCEVLKG